MGSCLNNGGLMSIIKSFLYFLIPIIISSLFSQLSGMNSLQKNSESFKNTSIRSNYINLGCKFIKLFEGIYKEQIASIKNLDHFLIIKLKSGLKYLVNLKKIRQNYTKLRKVSFSNDKSLLLTINFEFKAKIRNLINGNKLSIENIKECKFSTNNKYVLIKSCDNYLNILELSNCYFSEPILKTSNAIIKAEYANAFDISDNEKFVFIAQDKFILKIINLENREEFDYKNVFCFKHFNNLIFIQFMNGDLIIMDYIKKEIIKQFTQTISFRLTKKYLFIRFIDYRSAIINLENNLENLNPKYLSNYFKEFKLLFCEKLCCEYLYLVSPRFGLSKLICLANSHLQTQFYGTHKSLHIFPKIINGAKILIKFGNNQTQLIHIGSKNTALIIENLKKSNSKPKDKFLHLEFEDRSKEIFDLNNNTSILKTPKDENCGNQEDILWHQKNNKVNVFKTSENLAQFEKELYRSKDSQAFCDTRVITN